MLEPRSIVRHQYTCREQRRCEPHTHRDTHAHIHTHTHTHTHTHRQAPVHLKGTWMRCVKCFLGFFGVPSMDCVSPCVNFVTLSPETILNSDLRVGHEHDAASAAQVAALDREVSVLVVHNDHQPAARTGVLQGQWKEGRGRQHRARTGERGRRQRVGREQSGRGRSRRYRSRAWGPRGWAPCAPSNCRAFGENRSG